MSTRVCRKCKTEKALTDYYARSDGRREWWCKACRCQRHRERYPAIREYRQAKIREYTATHREVSRAATRRWNAKHPDYYKAWQLANPDKARAYGRRHYEKHRESEIARAAARRRSYQVEMTPAEWLDIVRLHRRRCLYCGKKVRALTKDHVKPISCAGRDTPWNVVPACRRCNSSKNDKPLIEWAAGDAALLVRMPFILAAQRLASGRF